MIYMNSSNDTTREFFIQETTLIIYATLFCAVVKHKNVYFPVNLLQNGTKIKTTL